MPIAAVIGGGASLGSAWLGYKAAGQAADAQMQAAMNAQQYQMAIYSQTKKDFQPYMDQGKAATASLADLYGLSGKGAQGVNSAFKAFTNLPAYQFPYQQGLRALNFNLSAQGRQQSGAEARETQQFGQGLASQYMMSNYVNPLMSMSSQGQGAASSLGQIGVGTGKNVGDSMQAYGQAQAGGYMGQANALAGGLNNASQWLGMYSMMNPMGGGGAKPPMSLAPPGMSYSSYGFMPNYPGMSGGQPGRPYAGMPSWQG